MTALQNIDDRLLVGRLNSALCPACGKPKQRANTFCARDYFALPSKMRPALYRRLGNGYRESVIAAMQYLGRTEFRTPEAQTPEAP